MKMKKNKINIANKPLRFFGFNVLKGGAFGEGILEIDGKPRRVLFVCHGRRKKGKIAIFYANYSEPKFWFKDFFEPKTALAEALYKASIKAEYPPKPSMDNSPRSILAEVPRHGGKSNAEKFALQCVSMHFSHR